MGDLFWEYEVSCRRGLGEVLTQRPRKPGNCSCWGGSSPPWMSVSSFPFPAHDPSGSAEGGARPKLNHTLSSPLKKVSGSLAISPSSTMIGKEVLTGPAWTPPNRLVARRQDHTVQNGNWRGCCGLTTCSEECPWAWSLGKVSQSLVRLPETESWQPLDSRCGLETWNRRAQAMKF